MCVCLCVWFLVGLLAGLGYLIWSMGEKGMNFKESEGIAKSRLVTETYLQQ